MTTATQDHSHDPATSAATNLARSEPDAVAALLDAIQQVRGNRRMVRATWGPVETGGGDGWWWWCETGPMPPDAPDDEAFDNWAEIVSVLARYARQERDKGRGA